MRIFVMLVFFLCFELMSFNSALRCAIMKIESVSRSNFRVPLKRDWMCWIFSWLSLCCARPIVVKRPSISPVSKDVW